MCVARVSAAPRAGVEWLEGGAAEPAAGASAGAAASAAAGASRAAVVPAVAAGASAGAGAAAGVAGVDEAGAFFIYLLSLVKGALRRACRCFEAPEILPTSHRA